MIYIRRNSNNPAQAKAYGGLGASGMLIYKFHIARYPLTVRYQANLPLLGVMFSPEYGESYYEIFSLGNGGRNVVFTSLHNNPSLRQLVTLDFPIRTVTLRTHYMVLRYTSLHNQPPMRQLLTLDNPQGLTTLRVGYLGDYQQSKVNNLKSHAYSHDFMIGFVRNLYLLRGKNRISMPLKVTPF